MQMSPTARFLKERRARGGWRKGADKNRELTFFCLWNRQKLVRITFENIRYINYIFFQISTISKSRHRLHTVWLTRTQIQFNSLYFFALYPPTRGFNINVLKVYLLGGACSTYAVEVHKWFWWGNLREGNYLQDPGVDRRIILRWIFRK